MARTSFTARVWQAMDHPPTFTDLLFIGAAYHLLGPWWALAVLIGSIIDTAIAIGRAQGSGP